MFGNSSYKYLTYSVKCKLKSQMTSLSSCLKSNFRRAISSAKPLRRRVVLGIETSCDDTGAAVVDDEGNILGNSLHSQTAISVEMGGVVPLQAKALHEKHIDRVVTEAIKSANIKIKDLDAVAVTNEPGMALSLAVGVSYAKSLVEQHGLPMIPIHHMQAHALTARMEEKIEFPFLVLLISGGHCLLAVAKDVDEFLLLGTCIGSVAPGEVFDKISRRLKLKTLPEYQGMCGGAMLEHMARNGDPYSYTISDQLIAQRKDCDFSFTGIKGTFNQLIEELEEEQGIEGSQILANAADICASVQFVVLRHILKRLQRCFLYCEYKDLLPMNKTLVVSGGVACNEYIRSGLEGVCRQFDCRLVCPPPHLCTDNGIMIAWNGMEKLKVGRGFAENPSALLYAPKKAIGEDLRKDVKIADIKTKKILTVDNNYFF